MADERIWTDVEYRLADEPEFIRPTGNSNFRQVENGIVIQNLFPNKNYEVRIRYRKGDQETDWISLPTMTTTDDGEILITFEFR